MVSTNAPVPQVVTNADLPVSDAPGTLAFAAPVATAPSAAPANIGRGIGGVVQVKVAFERPAGLVMVEHVGAIPDALDNVVESITIVTGQYHRCPVVNPAVVSLVVVPIFAVSSALPVSVTVFLTGGLTPLAERVDKVDERTDKD